MALADFMPSDFAISPRAKSAGPECLVVEVHFVANYAETPPAPGIRVAQLVNLVESLLQHYKPVTATDLASYFESGAHLPERCFYLTFDDGIKDHLTNVVPVLLRFGLEAAFFVPGSVVDGSGRLPTLERQRFLQYGFSSYRGFLENFVETAASIADDTPNFNIAPTEVNMARMGSYLSEYLFYSRDERYYRYLRDKVLRPDHFISTVDAMFEKRYEYDRAIIDKFYLSPSDLGELHSAGMTIGGHGFCHEHLPRLDDQAADIRKGLDLIASITGERPTIFSYPYGSYNATTLDIMAALGMKLAFTTQNCIARLDRGRRYEVTRVDVGSLLQ